MKRVIEEVVSRDQDIVKEVIRLAAGRNAWIFISSELYEYLLKNYESSPFFRDNGAFIFDNLKQSIGIASKLDNCELFWKKVNSVFSFSDAFVADDPEVIYFLSWCLELRGCPETGAQETKNPLLVALYFFFLCLLFQDTLFY